MRIAITGATGMIGRKLTAFLLAQGHHVAVITRQKSYQPPEVPAALSGTRPIGVWASVIVWDPELNHIEIDQLEDLDLIIHLAGSNIAKHWSPEYKKSIFESRVRSTKFLCDSLLKLNSKPKFLICASAIGFYGNHPPLDELDESSPSGQGFLADVCRQWEEMTEPVAKAGVRVVRMRLGVVLSKTGGALAKMLLPFQLGLGGPLGDGRQMMSWVALDEIPFIVDHLIKNKFISGSVNAVSPQPVSNAQFTKILCQVIHRPVFWPVPDFVIRLLFGEMGQSLLLEGVKVLPHRLMETGYKFRYADLTSTLQQAIG